MRPFAKRWSAPARAKNALLSATISLNLGTVLHLQGEVDEALKLYHQALEFHERIGAKRGVALASNNLGDLYWRGGQGDWDQALTHWQRALRLYDEIGDQRGLATALRNLGERTCCAEGSTRPSHSCFARGTWPTISTSTSSARHRPLVGAVGCAADRG